MKSKTLHALIILLAVVAATLVFINRSEAQKGVIHIQVPPGQVRAKKEKEKARNFDADIAANAAGFLQDGRETFRFDTFGDEAFWGGTLQLHQAIKGANLGGVGPGISPSTALNFDADIAANAAGFLQDGRETFRFDT